MKSISDYLNSAEGTLPANGKRFELYGMYIGRLKGGFVTGAALMFVRDDGEVMEVPLHLKKLPGFEMNGQEIGPVFNPILYDIKEV